MSALGAGPPPPDYVTEGGFLVHEGDMLVPCSSVGPDDDPAGARLCEQYGFGPSSGDGEPVVTYANPPGSDEPGPPCLEEDCIAPLRGPRGTAPRRCPKPADWLSSRLPASRSSWAAVSWSNGVRVREEGLLKGLRAPRPSKGVLAELQSLDPFGVAELEEP